MRIATLLALSAALLTVSIPPASAQSPVRTEVGVLRCQLAPTIGLIVGSRQRLRCQFHPSGPGPIENYSGAITRLGLDVGISAGGRMAWGVIARAGRYTPRAAGTYVGASGDIALGFGVGANALVGGSGRSIALQPLSVEASIGVNLALGVAGLTLR